MNIFKRLVKGELSVITIFWGFGSLSIFILPTLAFIAFSKPLPDDFKIILIAVIFLFRFIISLMVLSGLFFILRNKNQTFWVGMSFIIAIINIIYASIDLVISMNKVLMTF